MFPALPKFRVPVSNPDPSSAEYDIVEYERDRRIYPSGEFLVYRSESRERSLTKLVEALAIAAKLMTKK